MRQRPQISGLISSLLWALPYLFAAYASAILATGTGYAASIWLPAGVAMAALMLTRPEGWPAVMIGLAAAQTLFGMLQGAHLLLSVVIALIAIAAPGIALAIVVRFAQVPLHGLYFLRALFFAALIEGVLASALNNAILSPGGAAFWPGFQMRAIAHVVGIFIVTPVFTAWARFRPSRQSMRGTAERVFGALAFAALVPCALVVFGSAAGGSMSDNLLIGMSYVPLLLCALIALMWGARGGVISVLALALIALSQTASGYGPFGRTPDDESLLGVQLYLGVGSVLVLLITTLRSHREKALDSASRWRANMELALAGSGQLVYCLDTRTGHFEWGGDLEGITGRSPDAFATLDTVLAAISLDDRARARARWLRAADGQPTREMTFCLRTPQGGPVFITDTSQSISDLDESTAFIAGTWRAPRPGQAVAPAGQPPSRTAAHAEAA